MKRPSNIPFGLSNDDGRLYEPRQVPIGKNCGCVCPGCLKQLYAKHCLAEKVSPHFAHAPGTDCAAGYETALHLAAKQLIDDERMLALPSLLAKIRVIDALGRAHSPSQTVEEAGRRALHRVKIEQSIGKIRPDLIVEADGLGPVMVEIAVTHFVDEEKSEKIRAYQMPAVEVDLSSLRDANFEHLRRVLFDEPGNTCWLFHPAVADVEAGLLESLGPTLSLATKSRIYIDEAAALERARMAAEEVEWRRQRKINEVEAASAAAAAKRILRQEQHLELKRAAAFKERTEDEKLAIVLRRLGVGTLPPITNIAVPGAASFGVNPHLWQTTLFSGLIQQQVLRCHSWVKEEYALQWLSCRFHSTPEFPGSATVAVNEYLSALCRKGALIHRREGYYNIAVANAAALGALLALTRRRVSAESGLRWVSLDLWPTEGSSQMILRALRDTPELSHAWARIIGLLPSARSTSPAAVCEFYERLGLRRKEVMQFLVCAGFLVLSR